MGSQLSTQVITLNGKDFEVLTSGDQSSKKLALFLHGFPECAHAWRHQMPALAEAGYKCWAPNQRGYGNSYSPSEIPDYDMELLVEDMVQLIQKAACDSVLVIAHDWGGVVAWQLAQNHPELVERLVVMNCPHPAMMARELQKWRQLKKSWYIFAFYVPKLPEWYLTRHNARSVLSILRKAAVDHSHFTKQDYEVYRANALRPGGMKAMLNWYRAALRKRFARHKEEQAKPKKISVPTLIIWGEKDVALGIQTVQGTEKYVDNLTISYLPEVGHFVPEEDPDAVNQIMLKWLGTAHQGGKKG